MTLMSLSVAVSLLYTSPVFVTIFSVVLFKETVTKRKVIAVISAFLGCVLVSGSITNNATLTAMGFVVGLGAGLCFSLYSIFSRFAINKGYHPFTITAYTFICTTLGGSFFTDFGLVGQVYQNHKAGVILNIFILVNIFHNIIWKISMPFLVWFIEIRYKK